MRLAEIAPHSDSEGLLVLSVGAGLQVMQGTLMEQSVVALARPQGASTTPDR